MFRERLRPGTAGPAAPPGRVFSEWRTLGRLLRLTRTRVSPFAGSAALALAAAALEGLCAGLLIPVINGVLSRDASPVMRHSLWGVWLERLGRTGSAGTLRFFFFLIACIGAILVFKNLLSYTASVQVYRQVREFEHRLRREIYRRYLSFGKLYFDRHNAGQFYQTMGVYTLAVAQELANMHHLFYTASIFLVYLALMLMICWPLTVVVALACGAIYWVVRRLVVRMRRGSELYAASHAGLIRNLSNTLASIPLVKIYTAQRMEQERFDRSSRLVFSHNFALDRKKLLIEHAQEAILILMVIALGGFVTLFLFRRESDVGSLMVFVVLMRRFVLVSGGLSKTWASITSVRGPIRSIAEVFEDEGKSFVPDGSRAFAGLRDRIEFRGLDFSYGAGEEPVLRQVSFAAEKGRVTAIVGPSGSGKTTLIHLLLRFYDCPAGSILLDGTDIREFTHESLRSRVAFVGQDTLLFFDTIRANLLYGLDRGATDAEIAAAVEEAALGDFIRSLPEGLDTPIGDKGARLSEGEKQRLSIARAILKGAEIWILDEATNALDSTSERLVRETLSRAVRGRTALVIAHRLSTIRHADRVVVLESGRVAEEGAPGDLLARQGRFSRYWREQAAEASRDTP